MSFSLSFELRDGYLLCTTTGEEATVNDSLRKIRTVMQKGLDVGMRRFLMDERRLDFTLEAHDIAQVSDRLVQNNAQNNGNRVACLYNPKCEKSCRLRETMYQNRSVNYRVFDDEAAALAWLMR